MSNNNGTNGTLTTGILAVAGIMVVAFLVIAVLAISGYEDVTGLAVIVLAAAGTLSGTVLTLLSTRDAAIRSAEAAKQATVAASEARSASVKAGEASSQAVQTSKNVDGILHELMTAKTGQATAEATLAQIGVQEARAVELAKATGTTSTTTTTSTLESPASTDATIVAGVDAATPGAQAQEEGGTK